MAKSSKETVEAATPAAASKPTSDIPLKREFASVLEGLSKNKWLSDKSKEEAIQKISKASLLLMAPKNQEEWDFLPIKKMSKKNVLENQWLRMLASRETAFIKLSKPVNPRAWFIAPLTVNAFYSSQLNSFLLPVGILQYPFFVEDGDLIENLGAVGMVFGHELGHAIDDQGSKFDERGRLRQWMSFEERAHFLKLGEGLVQQFNKAGHRGDLTLGENIADLVGLTFAYQAAFPKNEGALEDKRKFFISYARLWSSI